MSYFLNLKTNFRNMGDLHLIWDLGIKTDSLCGSNLSKSRSYKNHTEHICQNKFKFGEKKSINSKVYLLAMCPILKSLG